MAYNRRDFYFKKAKSQGFAARSIFKLEDIQKKYRMVKPGSHILDLGCAPGSWSQFVSGLLESHGGRGSLLGIDLQKVAMTLPCTTFITGDAFSDTVIEPYLQDKGLLGFDVILSDMAPKTTGIKLVDQEKSFQLCERALAVCEKWLLPGGSFVCKIFQGASSPQFVELTRRLFEEVHIERPPSVRKESFEIYVVGIKRRK